MFNPTCETTTPSLSGWPGEFSTFHPHHSPDELDVGTEGAERPEDRGDGERRMIEALAEHLHLDNHVELPAAKIAQNLLLLVAGEVRVDLTCAQASFFVQAAHLPRMVERAGNGDQLVV